MGLLRKFGLTATENKNAINDRVLQDISNILNSHKGYSSFDPEFGIADCSHYTDQAMISEFIKAELIRNLSTYYPQIEVVKITDLPSVTLSRIQMLLEIRFMDAPLKIRVFNDQGLEKWIVAQ
jgi:hypothetical protein